MMDKTSDAGQQSAWRQLWALLLAAVEEEAEGEEDAEVKPAS